MTLGERLNTIRGIIYNEWSAEHISAEFSEMMRLAVSMEEKESAISGDRPEMALLPALCCWAAGGEASWADNIAAVWLLFYAAADIMDSLEDQDEPAAWWGDLGPAAALSAATGLFFSAASLLHRASTQEVASPVASQLIRDFYQAFMTMSSGQYADLRNLDPSIEAYWKIASQKSGAFFAIACRAGASLATRDSSRLNHYTLYGQYLGQLIQVLDDLEDFKFLRQPGLSVPARKLTRSLPVVYTYEMAPDPTKARLRFCLANAHQDPKHSLEAVKIMEDSGAVLYLNCEIEKNKQLAANQLNQAGPQSPAGEILLNYLDRLEPS